MAKVQTQETIFDKAYLIEHFSHPSATPCELDGKSLVSHRWVEFDKLGYVVACSERDI